MSMKVDLAQLSHNMSRKSDGNAAGSLRHYVFHLA